MIRRACASKAVIVFILAFSLFYMHLYFVVDKLGGKISSLHEVDTTVRSNRVYVCITGQLSRLELRNKINKVLLPLSDMGYELDIALALTTGPSRYTNNDNGDKLRIFKEISEVKTVLFKVRGVVGVEHISAVNNLPPVFFNKNYQNSLWYVNTTRRVENNAHQFQMLQYCNQPQVKNSSFFVRMREDTFILHMRIKPIVEKVLQSAVVTTECDAWWGMNDKMAFGPSLRAKEFFSAPYEYYLALDKVVDNFNPEQLYQNSYKEKNFDLLGTDDYVVTKSVLSKIKKNKFTQGENNCSVKGNPFQKWTKKCPEISRTPTLYKSKCFA